MKGGWWHIIPEELTKCDSYIYYTPYISNKWNKKIYLYKSDLIIKIVIKKKVYSLGKTMVADDPDTVEL